MESNLPLHELRSERGGYGPLNDSENANMFSKKYLVHDNLSENGGDDGDVFDLPELQPKTAGIFSSFLNMANSIIGAGIYKILR